MGSNSALKYIAPSLDAHFPRPRALDHWIFLSSPTGNDTRNNKKSKQSDRVSRTRNPRLHAFERCSENYKKSKLSCNEWRNAKKKKKKECSEISKRAKESGGSRPAGEGSIDFGTTCVPHRRVRAHVAGSRDETVTVWSARERRDHLLRRDHVSAKLHGAVEIPCRMISGGRTGRCKNLKSSKKAGNLLIRWGDFDYIFKWDSKKEKKGLHREIKISSSIAIVYVSATNCTAHQATGDN